MVARNQLLDEEVSLVTDDNEGTSPNQPAGSEETCEDAEVRTDGSQTIASNPLTRGPSRPVEPEGTPSMDGPGVRSSSVDSPISLVGDTGVSRESPDVR